jgi:NAD(P)H-flavin reductase
MEHSCKSKDASLFIPAKATLVRTSPMTGRDRFFEFALDGKSLGHKPGQFAEISIPGIGEAPVSISNSPTRGSGFEMVIRSVGRLTGALHALKPGDAVGVRGPFGTSFPMDALKGRDLLFVGGGIGLVPMRSAIQYAFDHRKEYGKITILFGCTDPGQRLFVDELAEWKKRDDVLFLESVDRGDSSWQGNVGVITTLFPAIKENLVPSKTTAIIVGPPVMYKFVIVELKNMGFRDGDIIVSLERNMKCGVGKCGHCQINNIYVCQDGPVFSFEAIKPLVEAL